MRPLISSRYDNWIINYLLHPIFLTEIYTFVGAVMLWRYSRLKPSPPGVASFVRVNQGIVGLAVLITAFYLLD